MTPRQLKRIGRQRPVSTRIIADGCRDYLVEVSSTFGAGLLTDRRGDRLRYRSLVEVYEVLRRCGIERSILSQRVAHDETIGGGGRHEPAEFADMPVTVVA